jgi:hypothetical protein
MKKVRKGRKSGKRTYSLRGGDDPMDPKKPATGQAIGPATGPATGSSKKKLMKAVLKSDNPQQTEQLLNPPVSTETQKNIEPMETCYKVIREKFAEDKTFEPTIKEIMETLPPENLSTVLYDPHYKEIRGLIRTMISTRIDQFKKELEVARVPITLSEDETTMKGYKVQQDKPLQTDQHYTSKEEAEEYKKKLEKMHDDVKKILETYTTRYGGSKASDISDEIVNNIKKNDDIAIKDYYREEYDFQKELLCGLHAINNLFIEERKEKNIGKFEKTLFDSICNIMNTAGLEVDGCPENGYYSVNVMSEIFTSLGYNVEHISKAKINQEAIIEKLKNSNNLGIILGSGSHWTALRRLNNNYVDFRNSITAKPYTPKIYNFRTEAEAIKKIFKDNGIIVYIIINAGKPAPTINSVNKEPSLPVSFPNHNTFGGAKTRSKRRGIRSKKTKRRSKK